MVQKLQSVGKIDNYATYYIVQTINKGYYHTSVIDKISGQRYSALETTPDASRRDAIQLFSSDGNKHRIGYR